MQRDRSIAAHTTLAVCTTHLLMHLMVLHRLPYTVWFCVILRVSGRRRAGSTLVPREFNRVHHVSIVVVPARNLSHTVTAIKRFKVGCLLLTRLSLARRSSVTSCMVLSCTMTVRSEL